MLSLLYSVPMNTKYLFIGLGVFIFCSGALFLTNQILFTQRTAITAPTNQDAIIAVIQKVLDTTDPYNKESLGLNVFSNRLYIILKQSRAVTEADTQRIATSQYPDDKPLLIEGNIFSSLYEGYTSYNIESVIEESNHATATIGFVNSDYKEQWTDSILLAREENWKIDNVIYDKDLSQEGSLQELLTSFIASATSSTTE